MVSSIHQYDIPDKKKGGNNYKYMRRRRSTKTQCYRRSTWKIIKFEEDQLKNLIFLFSPSYFVLFTALPSNNSSNRGSDKSCHSSFDIEISFSLGSAIQQIDSRGKPADKYHTQTSSFPFYLCIPEVIFFLTQW